MQTLENAVNLLFSINYSNTAQGLILEKRKVLRALGSSANRFSSTPLCASVTISSSASCFIVMPVCEEMCVTLSSM